MFPGVIMESLCHGGADCSLRSVFLLLLSTNVAAVGPHSAGHIKLWIERSKPSSACLVKNCNCKHRTVRVGELSKCHPSVVYSQTGNSHDGATTRIESRSTEHRMTETRGLVRRTIPRKPPELTLKGQENRLLFASWQNTAGGSQ